MIRRISTKKSTKAGAWGSNSAYGATHIPGYLCPSAAEFSDPNNTTSTWYVAHYLGLSGPCRSTGPYTNPITGQQYDWLNVPGQGGENYGGYAMDGVLVRGLSTKMRDITDGTSNTFLVGESDRDKDKGNARCWLRGGQNNSSNCSTKNVVNAINTSTPNFNNKYFGSNHIGGAYFGFADGSVLFVSEDIDMNIYYGLSSRKGGENVTLEE